MAINISIVKRMMYATILDNPLGVEIHQKFHHSANSTLRLAV